MKNSLLLLTFLFSLTLSAQEKEFDFDKYKDSMLELAVPRFLRSVEPVRFVDYALIDIDGDGKKEVWVRSDEGQSWQGVFSVDGDKVTLLADADVTSDLQFYKNAVGYSGYISPGRVDEAYVILKNSRIVASCEKHMEFNIFSDDQESSYEEYRVNDKDTDEDGYVTFVLQLGDAITMTPVWHSIK